jgi:hypothetical protein
MLRSQPRSTKARPSVLFNTEREVDRAIFNTKFETFRTDYNGVIQDIQRELEQMRELFD